MSLVAPNTPRLDDEDMEITRREFQRTIVELQSLPLAGARVIKDVTLASSVATPIPHGLGRAAQFVTPSCIRGASTVGMVEEIRDGSVDRSKFINLRATGYGATITIDLVVL